MSGGRAAASLATSRPPARRDEQRLRVQVGKAYRRQVCETLDADVPAPPLGEELAVERVEPLELEHVVGQQETAANEPAQRRLHALRREEVGQRAEVEGKL